MQFYFDNRRRYVLAKENTISERFMYIIIFEYGIDYNKNIRENGRTVRGFVDLTVDM